MGGLLLGHGDSGGVAQLGAERRAAVGDGASGWKVGGPGEDRVVAALRCSRGDNRGGEPQ